MFNFHKPRVYRSTDGCCICRAKSSSSRFTDSRKYEIELTQCFNLTYPRNGEICNACVLLVKRYKRLPVGSKRHWGHVVDARVGPGTKSFAKQKKRDEWNETSNGNRGGNGAGKSFIPEKFAKIFKKNRSVKVNETTVSKIIGNVLSKTSALTTNRTVIQHQGEFGSDNQSGDSNESDNDFDEQNLLTNGVTTTATTLVRLSSSSLIDTTVLTSGVVQFQTQTRAVAAAQKRANAAFAAAITCGKTTQRQKMGSKRRRLLAPAKNRRVTDNVPFFDDNDLVRHQICCGVVYHAAALGPDAIIIDAEDYRPCVKHRKKMIRNDIEISGNTTKTTVCSVHTAKQKQPIATLPAIVRLEPSSVASVIANNNNKININNNQTTGSGVLSIASSVKSEPVLKKHHLFFKRQSESFPHGDINYKTTNISVDKTEIITPSKSPPTTPSSPTVGSAVTSSADVVYMPVHSISPPLPIANVGKSSLTNVSFILKPTAQYVTLQTVQPSQTSLTTSVGAASPSSFSSSSNCSSTSSSSSTKFNDNSSDSGFDEHMHERKSVSPLSQDVSEHKTQSRCPGLQHLILASGLQITGQSQNLVLAGNEFVARLLQQRQTRRPQQYSVANHSTTKVTSNISATASLTATGETGSSDDIIGCHVAPINNNNRIRTIYNNSNTIQHENGVTTILPASSVAASNQTAAMNAFAPSSVTITPAIAGSAAKKITLTNVLLNSSSNQIHAQQPLPLTINNTNNNNICDSNNLSNVNQNILAKNATKTPASATGSISIVATAKYNDKSSNKT